MQSMLDSSMLPTTQFPSIYHGRLQYVDAESLRRKYACALCSEIVHSPRQTHCGQRVCLECIEKEFHGSPMIPECPLPHDGDDMGYSDEEMNGTRRKGFTLQDFSSDHFAKKQLALQKVYCPNRGEPSKDCAIGAEGCPVVVIQKRIANHLRECDYRKAKCKNESCEAEFFSKDEVRHMDRCPQAEIRCPDCGEMIKRHTQADHSDQSCLNARETQCKCGRYFKKRSELKDHQSMSSLESCTAFSQLTGTCGYQKYGCEHQATDNVEFRKHLKEDSLLHLEQLTIHLETDRRKLPSNEDSISVKNKVRPLDYTVADLYDETQKVQEKMQETEAARGVLDNMNKQVKILVADMEIIGDKQRSSDKAVDGKIRHQERTIDTMQTELATLGPGANSAISQGSGSQGSSSQGSGSQSSNSPHSTSGAAATISRPISSSAAVSLLSDISNIPTTNGELVWVIDDYTSKYQRAVLGEQKMLLSPPFYTSRQGYKMRARVYLYGDGTNRGRFMSVYFVLMRGKHDHILPWPFQRRISLAIVKPNTGDIGEKPRVYVPDKGVAFQRPVQEKNPATGCPDFLEVTKVRDNYVSSRDQLTIIVTVETQAQTDSLYQQAQKWRPPRAVAMDTVN